MNIKFLQTLLANKDVEKTINILNSYSLVKSIEDALKQYLPSKHDVTEKSKRPDKTIVDSDNNTTAVVPVNRISLPFQKKIVMIAAAFLGTPEAESSPADTTEENLLAITNKVLTDNKIDYKFKNIAKITMSEKACAELWYTQDTDSSYWQGYPIRQTAKHKLRMRVLAQSLGDKLYPVFDSYGDMIAFGRGYEIKELTSTGSEQTNQYFDIYTADKFYYYTKEGSGNWEIKEEDNPIKKIPVIYYSQPYTEWEDVQVLIDRLETKISNHADTNDYFDSPVLILAGDQIEQLSGKSEQGKAFQLKGGSSANYLTWDQAPESMKMEIENLLKFIHTFTNTPDISFESLKGLGVFSGIALKMLFMDAHMKASDKEEIFGEGIQRRYNYIKNALAYIDKDFSTALKMDIKPKFKYFLPENIEEQVNILVNAVNAKLMSRKTAVGQNPLVSNAENELELIAEETETDSTNGEGGQPNDLTNLPFALKQLITASNKARESRDLMFNNSLNEKINELLKTVKSGNNQKRRIQTRENDIMPQ